MSPAFSTRANARSSPQQKSAQAFYKHTSPKWLLRSCDYDPVMMASRRGSCLQRVRSELSLCGETVLPMLSSQSDDPSSTEMDPPHREFELPNLNSPKPTRRRVEFNPHVKVSSRWPSSRSRSPNRSFSNTPFDLKGTRTRSGTLLGTMNSSVHSLRRGDSRLISPRSSFVSSVSRTPSSRRSLFCLRSGTDILPPPPQFRSDRSSSFIGLSNGRSSHDTSFLFSQSKSAGLNSSNVSWDKRFPQSKPSAPIVPRPSPAFRSTRQCASDVPVTSGYLLTASPRTSKENTAIKRDEDTTLFGSRKMTPEIRRSLRRWMHQDRTVHRSCPRDQRTVSDHRLSKAANLGISLKPRREALVKYRPTSDFGQRKISHVSPACSGNVRKWDVGGTDTARRTKTTTGPSAQSWSMKARLNLSDFGKAQAPRETSPERSSLRRRRSPRRHESTEKGHVHNSPKSTGFDAKVFSVPEVRLGHSLSTEDKLGIVQEWLKRKSSNPIMGSSSDGGLCKYRTPYNTSSYLGGRRWSVPRNNLADLRIGSNKFPSGDVDRSTGPYSPKREANFSNLRRLQDLRPDFCNVAYITARKKSMDNTYSTRSITPRSPLDNNTNARSENLIYAKSSSEPYLHRSRVYRDHSPLRTSTLSKATPSSSEPHVLHTRCPMASRNASPIRSSRASKTNPSERTNSPGRLLKRSGSPNRNVNTPCKAEQKLGESKSSKLHSQNTQSHYGGAVKPVTSYDSRILHSNLSPTGENRKVNKCRTGTPTTSKRVLKASTSPSPKKTSIPSDNKPAEKIKEQHKANPVIKSKVVKSQVSNNEYVKNFSSKRKKINFNLRIVSSEVEMPVRRTHNRRFEKRETKCTSIPQHSTATPSMVPPRRFYTSAEARESTPKSPKRSSTRNSNMRNASEDHPKTHVWNVASEDTHKGHKESQKNANKTEGKVLRNKRSQKPTKRKILRVQVPLPLELLQACKENADSTDTLTRKSDSAKSNLEIRSPEAFAVKRPPINDNIPSINSQKNKCAKPKKTTEASKVEVKDQKGEGTKPKLATSPKRQCTHVSLEQRSTPDTTILSGFTDSECEKPRSNAVKTSPRREKCSPIRTHSSADTSTPNKDNSEFIDHGTRKYNHHHSPRSKVKLSRSRFREGSPLWEGDRGRQVNDGVDSKIRLSTKQNGSEVKQAFDALPLHNQYALNDFSALMGIARLLNIDADSCLNMVGLNVRGKKAK